MKYNIHEAKTHFSKLVAAVEAAETVTICRNGKPVANMVPPGDTTKPHDNSHLFGSWKHLMPAAEGKDRSHLADPTDDEMLDEMGL